MQKNRWAEYVTQKRNEQQLTRRKLAEMASIDPSYVTLIERDGYVPRRDKVIEIAKAVRSNIDKALLVAGYAPETTPIDVLLSRTESHLLEENFNSTLRETIISLGHLNEHQQLKVAEMLRAYVQTLQDTQSIAAKANASLEM